MKKAIKITLLIFAIAMLMLTTVMAIYITNIMKESKKIEFNKDKLLTATTQVNIYDSDDNLINVEAFDGKNVAKIGELSPTTTDAFVSIEDKKFYTHNGLNYKRIVKAMINNIKSGRLREGASTISQQLIKNTHLTNEKTLSRKIKEVALTKRLEKTFTKDEILEIYLNVIYFGNGCYGIEEASQFYFDKPAKELNIQESATLAGMIKAPATYCPINHYEACLNRRNIVLKEMYEDGKISDEEYYKALNSGIELQLNKKDNICDEIYISAVKNEAENLLNIDSRQIALRGYKIYTYYDSISQQSLENSLNNDNNYHKNSYGNIADSLGAIINNKACGIEAFYGKSIYNLTDFNRQPGSAIKPILVYAPALEQGEIYNCSEILDEPINYDGYSPNNVGNIFHGYTSIRDCVASSLNIPAVKIMDYVGIENCKNFASKVGINFNNYDNGYALALGGFNEGVTLTELLGSYVPFACDGQFVAPSFIRKITTSDGIEIYNKDEKKHQIMGEDTAYLMNDLLMDGVKNGTSRRLNSLPYQVCGKTGTVAIKGTNLNSDAYSIAYTSEHIVGIWLGNYSFDEKYNLEGCNNGGTYCTSMVKDVFDGIYSDHHPQDFVRPESIVELEIDDKNLIDNHTIKLAGSDCPERYKKTEIFSIRHTPKEYSDIYTNFDINFNVELDNNIAKIKLNALDYLIYDIYVDDKLIESIENKSGEINFTYDKLEPNKMYTFYVDAHCEYSDAIQKSDEVSVYTKNLYENLIDDNFVKPIDSNLSWYFY